VTYCFELSSHAGASVRSGIMKFWKPWFLRARLKTRHLLLLSAIGEEGNICRAAEMLSMSQPAASRLLRDLEQIIGASLFERQARGVKANWYGEVLIRHARNALTSLNKAAEEIDALKDGRTGQVNVGSIAGPAVSLLPQALVRLTRDYPLVRVRVTVESSDRLLQLLDDRQLDFMVGRLPTNADSARLSFERLGEEPVCAVARSGHPMRTSSSLGLRDLVQASWIVPPVGSILRQRFECMFREAGLDCPSRLLEMTSPLVLTKVLGQTDFIAILPGDVAQHYASCGLVAELPLDLPCRMDSFGVIARKDCLLSPAAQLMREALEDATPGDVTPGDASEPEHLPQAAHALAEG
jgi:DNA-binding transcriptional LysR family regulator